MKRNGEKEDFDRKKLERSIVMAGASPESARDIALSFRIKEGVTTDEIRQFVFEELRNLDPMIGQRYERTYRFMTCRTGNTVRGVAKISEGALHRLRIMVGETFHLVNKDRSITLIAEKAPIGDNEICLHEEDLEAIGAVIGEKIVTKKQK